MRVGMMIRDTEYRDAMVEKIAGLDKDIFVEVAGTSGVSRESVILTDIMPSEIEKSSLEKIRKRTLFLSPVPSEHGSEYHVVFKYSSMTTIMAELSYVYSEWTGNTGSISPATRVIAVTGESDHLSGARCRALSGQILYRHGGSVLILPLSYVSDYPAGQAEGSRDWFRRLMYMIDEGIDYMPDVFTYTDSYGTHYLKLRDGINPLTELSIDYLGKLINSMAGHFDTIILDIGSCFSSVNIAIMESADDILYFGSGRRIHDIREFVGEKSAGRVRKIKISDAGRETLSLDDYVKEIYGNTDKKKDRT